MNPAMFVDLSHIKDKKNRDYRRALLVALSGGPHADDQSARLECDACGWDDVRVLSVRPRSIIGVLDARQFPTRYLFYDHVLDHADDYHLLCANCTFLMTHQMHISRRKAKGAFYQALKAEAEAKGLPFTLTVDDIGRAMGQDRESWMKAADARVERPGSARFEPRTPEQIAEDKAMSIIHMSDSVLEEIKERADASLDGKIADSTGEIVHKSRGLTESEVKAATERARKYPDLTDKPLHRKR